MEDITKVTKLTHNDSIVILVVKYLSLITTSYSIQLINQTEQTFTLQWIFIYFQSENQSEDTVFTVFINFLKYFIKFPLMVCGLSMSATFDLQEVEFLI